MSLNRPTLYPSERLSWSLKPDSEVIGSLASELRMKQDSIDKRPNQIWVFARDGSAERGMKSVLRTIWHMTLEADTTVTVVNASAPCLESVKAVLLLEGGATDNSMVRRLYSAHQTEGATVSEA